MESNSGEGQPHTPGHGYSAEEARRMLASLGDDGARLAEQVITPRWYHPVLGLIVAVLVGSQALPGAYPLFVALPALIAIPLLTLTYSSRYGVTLTHTTGPGTKRLMFLIVGVMVLCIISAAIIKIAGVDLWWALIPVIIAFASTVVLGRRYDNVLRRELSDNVGRPV